MKKILMMMLSVIILASVAIYIIATTVLGNPEFGGSPLHQRTQLAKSKHFSAGKFVNSLPPRDMDIWINIKEYFGDQNRIPPGPFPLVKPKFTKQVKPGLRAVWFGHASVLVEIDNKRIFFDPMLSEYAFPITFLAPKRMNPSPMDLTEIPKIDAVVISHDHFDHLDMKTIQYLNNMGASFFVGLGVGSHLRRWGVKDDRIFELDWGQSAKFQNLTVYCTEARHYSGRKSMNKSTLWASWLIKGPKHSVFHSGDTGYGPHFKSIGQRFKSIDLSLIKVGDYGQDPSWQDVHMPPEDSIQAHLDLGAKRMIPIHWGVFNLSNHAWDEPIERTLTAAKAKGARLALPKIGQTVDSRLNPPYQTWWRQIKAGSSASP